MAGLAGHVHFGPARIEAVGLRVVALLEAGGVAGDAHGVGRLVAAGPVQHVAGRRLLVGQQVEPLAFARVPGNLQRLQPALAGVDQVLLQRFVAEGVGDLEVGHAAVGAVGVHHVLVAAPEEARGHALVPELRVVEVAAHRLRLSAGPWPWHGATAPRPRRSPGGSPDTGRFRHRWAVAALRPPLPGSGPEVAGAGLRASHSPAATASAISSSAAAHRPRRLWPAGTAAGPPARRLQARGRASGAAFSPRCSGFRPVAAGSAPTARRRWHAGCPAPARRRRCPRRPGCRPSRRATC